MSCWRLLVLQWAPRHDGSAPCGLPSALPYLFAAAKLAVPRALLGVMIAEWLATGRGLGNLMNQSRGFLDYGMIWAVAIVSVLISLLLYQAILMAEHQLQRRLGQPSG